MKSIKEKAKEYEGALYTEEIFKTGANYVLDEIEKFLNLYGIYGMTSSTRAYLKNMIEQLKSNQ